MSESDPHGSNNIEYDAEVDDRIIITSEDEDPSAVDMFRDDQKESKQTTKVASNIKNK
jgi:hypothetical protein